jgi:hypothetical protein
VARLEDVRQEGQALDDAADKLEGRLLAAQSSVSLWQELAERHRHISVAVTQNQTAHFEAMVQLLARQEEKARQLKQRHYAKRSSRGSQPEGIGGPDENDPLDN